VKIVTLIMTRRQVLSRLPEICDRGAILEEIGQDLFRVTFA